MVFIPALNLAALQKQGAGFQIVRQQPAILIVELLDWP